MGKKENNKDVEKRARIEVLAERLKLFLGFAAHFIDDIDLLKEVAEKGSDRASTVMAAAPIIEAFGMDWEEKHFEAELQSKRAAALYNLVKVIKETEDDRIKHQADKVKSAAGRDQLRRALGI